MDLSKEILEVINKKYDELESKINRNSPLPEW